ncbi:MAG TPA: metallopeptidase TldD-related protein [Candidatus Methanoperedens sp.]|nr:metallopeptidase TldD-related protein [Candidatus Methanoperedens sp.]
MTTKRLERALGEALLRAARAGSRRAEAFCVAGSGRTVEYTDRGLETYRGASATGIGLRVFVGRRAGFASGQEFTGAGLDRLARRAVAAARLADLPAFPTPRGHTVAADLAILDAAGLAASVADDRDRLEAVLSQALAADPAVRRVKTVSLRSARREVCVWSSAGTQAAYARSSFALAAGVVAERGGESEMGWESDVATSREALAWAGLGATAARKAVARLGAGRAPGGRQPVILHREVVAEFLALLGAALSADAVLKGKSLYAGKVGTRQASGAVTIVDDPTLPAAAGSAPCDDEGQPTRRKVLLEAGVLNGYLHSLETAHRMGERPSGNGFRRDHEATPLPRPGNLVLTPGRGSVGGWAADAGSILLVEDILGAHTMNPVSGDFSVGASGKILAGGAARPFRGATIAGNLGALFQAISAVGDDLRFFGGVGAPSVLVRELDISA